MGDAEILMDEQLRLREDAIYQLKQQGYALQQRIKELTSKNDELKRQLQLLPTFAFKTLSGGLQVL
jgi:hypothetical protein